MTLISARSSVSARSFGHLQSLNGEHWIGTVQSELVAIDSDEDRNVYFAGRDYGTASYDNNVTYEYTRKSRVSPYGGNVWALEHENSNADTFLLHSARDSSGNIYSAGGYHLLVTDTYVFFIVKYDADANIIWEAAYSGNIGARGVVVDGLDNVYILTSNNGNQYHVVSRVDPTNGSLVWSNRASITGSSGVNLVGDPSGGVFVYTSTGSVTYLTKLTVDGDVSWSNSNVGVLIANSTDKVVNKPIACGNSDNLYVVTGTESLTKYDASTGQPEWSVKITGGILDLQNVFVNDSGEVYVAGEQDFEDSEGDFIGSRGVVLKFNSAGTILWQRYADVSSSGGIVPAYDLLVMHVDNYDNMYFASDHIGSSLTNGPCCFVAKLPGDGSKSQSKKFFVDIARYERYHTFVYAPSSLVVQAQTPAAFTSGAPTLTSVSSYPTSTYELPVNDRGASLGNWYPI